MARARRPRPPNKKGRTEGGERFIAIPMRVFLSDAYSSLSTTARALLVELVAIYNGRNNGSLWMSNRDGTDRLGLSDHHSTTKAFEEIVSSGLIVMTKEAHFRVKASETSRARCWRLAWKHWAEGPKHKRAPEQQWEAYVPPPKSRQRSRVDRRNRANARYRKAMSENRMPVVETTMMESNSMENEVAPVVETTIAKAETYANQPSSIVVDSTAHIDITRGSRAIGWWSSDPVVQLEAISMALHMAGAGGEIRRAA